jgi:hypothetical protein
MHKELEKYLLQMEKQLSALPTEQRQEELREIRSHLELMIEDNIAHGCDADEAVIKALGQFGAADKIGRDLIAEKNKSWRQRNGVILALILIWGLGRIQSFVSLWLIKSAMLPGNILNDKWLSFWSLNTWSFCLCFLCGWVAETYASRKSLAVLTCVVFVNWGSLFFTNPSLASALVSHPFPNIPNVFRAFAFGLLTMFTGVWARRYHVQCQNRQSQVITK